MIIVFDITAINMPRKAEEVFVHMNKDFRISRNIRAHWFFDHINQEIAIERHGNNVSLKHLEKKTSYRPGKR